MWRTNLFCVHKILPVGVKVNSIANVYTVNHGREKINFRIRVKTSRDCFCQSHFFRMTFMLLSVMHLFQQINTFELEHIQKFFIVRDSHCAISSISVRSTCNFECAKFSVNRKSRVKSILRWLFTDFSALPFPHFFLLYLLLINEKS